MVEQLLRAGVSCIAEAAFQHRLWAPRLEPLAAQADLRVLHCRCDPRLARQRFIARGLADPDRVRFHGDAAVQAARDGRELPIGDYQPPELPHPTLVVDTSHGYALDLAALRDFCLT
ncbi:MAG: ATP-binding protein [Planctomycetota bacterium]